MLPWLLLLSLSCRKVVDPEIPAADPADPWVMYAAALEDARFPLPSEVAPALLALTPEAPGLRWDDAGRLLVITWTRGSYFSDPAYVPGHEFPLYGETWFTAGEEVRRACRGMESPAVERRLEALLGLPPGGDRDAFLLAWIEPSALFRPCAEPDVTAPTCPIQAPLLAGADSVSWSCDGAQGYARWMCDNWVSSYGASEIGQRFPWTALGYTYDWSRPQAPIGATEFVAPAGTSVRFEALVPTVEFCRQSQQQ